MIKFGQINGASQAENYALQMGLEFANKVLMSPQFEAFMLARKLVQMNELDNAGVLAMIRTDVTLDIEIYSPWWPWSSQDACTTYPSYPGGTPLVSINRRLINTPFDLGDTILHESTHANGFDHDYRATQRRPYSVPYSANAGYELVAQALGILMTS